MGGKGADVSVGCAVLVAAIVATGTVSSVSGVEIGFLVGTGVGVLLKVATDVGVGVRVEQFRILMSQ